MRLNPIRRPRCTENGGRRVSKAACCHGHGQAVFNMQACHVQSTPLLPRVSRKVPLAFIYVISIQLRTHGTRFKHTHLAHIGVPGLLLPALQEGWLPPCTGNGLTAAGQCEVGVHVLQARTPLSHLQAAGMELDTGC